MKSEIFVKKEFPKAIAEKNKNSEGKTYWLIKKYEKGDYIAVAKTKAKAWDEAKQTLLRRK
jgi:hypothetical protein